MNNLTIAISKASGDTKYDMYMPWLQRIDPSIRCIDLSAHDTHDALNMLKNANGLLLSGGPDIDPARYGKAEKRSMCRMSPERDTFEYALLEHAAETGIPTLGICRGMQLLNVFFGGTLIADIATERANTHPHRNNDGTDSSHDLIPSSGLMKSITDGASATINSFHHQAVENIASAFDVTAVSSDGIIEAIEMKDASTFMLGVQWHPERMDANAAPSRTIGHAFLEQARRR